MIAQYRAAIAGEHGEDDVWLLAEPLKKPMGRMSTELVGPKAPHWDVYGRWA
jgi:hypothetical protein